MSPYALVWAFAGGSSFGVALVLGAMYLLTKMPDD